VFECFSIVVGTIGASRVGVYVLVFVVIFLRGALFEERWWRGNDCLGGGGALVKRVNMPAVLGCCFKSL
jgi:hypothetical protein